MEPKYEIRKLFNFKKNKFEEVKVPMIYDKDTKKWVSLLK